MKKLIPPMLILVLVSVFLSVGNPTSAPSVLNVDTGLYYSSIQSAIDDPSTLDGHTILVYNGTYYENVYVNKSLTIIGENQAGVILDGSGETYGFKVNASMVTIKNFTIRNAYRGIAVWASQSTIADNRIQNCSGYGVWMFSESMSNQNLVTDNYVSDCPYGIEAAWGNSNEITCNYVENVAYGIPVYGSNNIVKGNMVKDAHARGEALTVSGANNTIIENTLCNSDFGVHIQGNATFYRNNFISNEQHALIPWDCYDIKWDNGAEGNYWDNCTGEDTDADGILETSYIIKDNYVDHHPLKRPWSETNTFNVSGYLVSTYSNSTVGDPLYDGEKLSINVTGPPGTTGFLNITVPKEMFSGNPEVIINRESTLSIISYNATHFFIYLTYNHSTNNIMILKRKQGGGGGSYIIRLK